MTFAGVEKTVIAAFAYKRFKKANPQARLLFVVRRKEVLEQSIQTFQEILNDFKNMSGLTAVPDRMDEKDILKYFNGRTGGCDGLLP